jgi:hypothetical protein
VPSCAPTVLSVPSGGKRKPHHNIEPKMKMYTAIITAKVKTLANLFSGRGPENQAILTTGKGV